MIIVMIYSLYQVIQLNFPCLVIIGRELSSMDGSMTSFKLPADMCVFINTYTLCEHHFTSASFYNVTVSWLHVIVESALTIVILNSRCVVDL